MIHAMIEQHARTHWGQCSEHRPALRPCRRSAMARPMSDESSTIVNSAPTRTAARATAQHGTRSRDRSSIGMGGGIEPIDERTASATIDARACTLITRERGRYLVKMCQCNAWQERTWLDMPTVFAGTCGLLQTYVAVFAEKTWGLSTMACRRGGVHPLSIIIGITCLIINLKWITK
jgi:hypothetical protein